MIGILGIAKVFIVLLHLLSWRLPSLNIVYDVAVV